MARHARLLTLSVIVDADDTDTGDGASELDAAMNRLIDAAQTAFPLEHPQGVAMAWSTTLDPRGVNCGQCAECGTWVSDLDQPDAIAGLSHGARVDGRLLCDDHLPPGHEHAF